MKLDYRGFHYLVKFQYDGHVVTLCNIYKKDSGESVVQGVAVCSPRDQYNKRVGRKIAFQKALQMLDFALGIPIQADFSHPVKEWLRSERTLAWSQYKEQLRLT